MSLRLAGDRAGIDFAGTAPQTRGPAIPPNEGLARSLEIVAPEGSLVNPSPPAAVAGGNVETSQRARERTPAEYTTKISTTLCRMSNLPPRSRSGDGSCYCS